MYRNHVTLASGMSDPSIHEELYGQAGFNGCIGSADATHVGMLKCASWAGVNHKGFKLHIPSRTYNLTTSHCRRILGSITGHPATWNDKTIILYDSLIRGVKDGDILQDYEFQLCEINSDVNIVQRKYKGVLFIVDN